MDSFILLPFIRFKGLYNEEWVFKPGYFGREPCGMWILMFNLVESLKISSIQSVFSSLFFLAVNMYQYLHKQEEQK